MALLLSVGAKAQDKYDFDLTASSWGWCWQATPSNEGGILKGVIESEKDAGTISRGWGPAENWSRYNKIVAVIEKYTGTSGAIQIKNGDTQIAQKYFGTISSSTTLTLDFNPADFTAVTQLEFFMQGTGTEIQISRVYLEEAYKYTTPGTSLTYDQYGNVNADQFTGMTDQTKVVFTYTLTMNGTYDIADYQGWGIGKIEGSGDNHILVTNISSKSAGDVDVVVSKGDLNAALADENTQYHYYAVNFNVWNLGGGENPVYGTTVRKSVTAYSASAYCTIGTIGWSSFCSQAPLDFSDSEVEAYIATSVDASKVTLKKVNGTVAAGTGLLLKGTAGQKYYIPVALSGTDYSSTNNLVAAASERTITDATPGDNYVLSVDNSSNPIFAKVDNELYPATVGAGKAYLHFDVSPSRTLTFNIEDEVTGINETKATKAHNTNTFFNLAGQRISQPTKGVYIVNGKKVIIK